LPKVKDKKKTSDGFIY